ncbi:hypothetical protein [Streptomyces sp. NBC_00648]|uniref:hypothetical protein n=1 Tax=Streptomyces sp. NBC_00648 TaxID=2975797 RepID=UPI0032511C3D
MIGDVDTKIASGLVGDGKSLIADRDILYSGAAAIFREDAPSRLPSGSHPHFLADTVKRVNLDYLIVEGARAISGEGVSEAPEDSPGPLRPRLSGVAGSWWVWDKDSDASPSIAYGNHLERVLRQHELDDILRTTRVTEEQEERSVAALSLVRELLPQVAATTFPFVHHLVYLDGRILSMNLPQVPESVFISTELLGRDTIELADALLHESLHEKMVVLRLTRRLMRAGYTDDDSATFLLPWSIDYEKPRHFNAGRIISAAHVYAHLAVLHCAALLRDSSGGGVMTDLHRSRISLPYARAACLLDAMTREHVRDEFGEDGRLLREVLVEALESVRAELHGVVELEPHGWLGMSESALITPSEVAG